MASYNKFNQFVDDLCKGVHNMTTSGTTYQMKVALTNTAPVATNTVLANITQISGTNGYTTNGTNTTGTLSNASGTEKLVCTDVVFTASGGTMGPFRYAVLFNDTPVSPAKPLVGWWDYGSAITLNPTETFTVDFDATNGVWQLV
jgi:hypothetical protein